MIRDIRVLPKVLSFLMVVVMATGVAHSASDAEPTYVPEGTWLAVGTLGPVRVPFMDTYASLQNQHGVSGTVLCTLSVPVPALPLGPDGSPVSVAATQTAHGSWVRTQKNVYAFTAWRILIGPTGHAVAWVKFWGTIRPDAPDHFLGEMNAAFYTLEFSLLAPWVSGLPTEGWRLAVDVQ